MRISTISLERGPAQCGHLTQFLGFESPIRAQALSLSQARKTTWGIRCDLLFIFSDVQTRPNNIFHPPFAKNKTLICLEQKVRTE